MKARLRENGKIVALPREIPTVNDKVKIKWEEIAEFIPETHDLANDSIIGNTERNFGKEHLKEDDKELLAYTYSGLELLHKKLNHNVANGTILSFALSNIQVLKNAILKLM